jgi:hypothetical protein
MLSYVSKNAQYKAAGKEMGKTNAQNRGRARCVGAASLIIRAAKVKLAKLTLKR